MKNTLWLLVFVLVGCSKEPELFFKSSQLLGTWNGLATLTVPIEKPFTRWTFTPEYVYLLGDTLKTCQPVNNNSDYNHSYRYWIENDVIVMRYVGFTTGLFPIPDIRWHISSITATEVILDGPRQVLEKCP